MPTPRLRHERSTAVFGHGAPLRLRNELELGFKQVKWIKGIEFVADFSDIGSGFGGYNQDHEFFGYRQSL
jgi:DMSO/TMAO reductase YedYZ molybdopterin-dependent catalytic subunit